METDRWQWAVGPHLAKHTREHTVFDLSYETLQHLYWSNLFTAIVSSQHKLHNYIICPLSQSRHSSLCEACLRSTKSWVDDLPPSALQHLQVPVWSGIADFRQIPIEASRASRYFCTAVQKPASKPRLKPKSNVISEDRNLAEQHKAIEIREYPGN